MNIYWDSASVETSRIRIYDTSLKTLEKWLGTCIGPKTPDFFCHSVTLQCQDQTKNKMVYCYHNWVGATQSSLSSFQKHLGNLVDDELFFTRQSIVIDEGLLYSCYSIATFMTDVLFFLIPPAPRPAISFT